jgi:hypothetical protein
MSSVTGRINSITQPIGGYINPSAFEVINLKDGKTLNSHENIHATYIGLTVDYLTRFCMGTNLIESFKISLHGTLIAEKFGKIPYAKENAQKYLSEIKGLDDLSIVSACKLTSFDIWYRHPRAALTALTHNDINPDPSTIQNIRTLTERSIAFWKDNGPLIGDGFDFYPVIKDKDIYKKMMETKSGSYGGYTSVVNTGDGDFLTEDTLWDLKVLKSEPKPEHTLQLLMYWIMGKHSGQNIYKNISKIGIYNPRLNKRYTLDMNKVSENTIKAVEKDVICY